jgi:hypothetical protein
VFKPPVRVTAPVKEDVPDTANVPVIEAPVAVTATTVVAPESNERLPVASAVVTTPPVPVVIAAIVEAIYISSYP